LKDRYLQLLKNITTNSFFKNNTHQKLSIKIDGALMRGSDIFHYADMTGNVAYISSEHSSALSCMLSVRQPKYCVN